MFSEKRKDEPVLSSSIYSFLSSILFSSSVSSYTLCLLAFPSLQTFTAFLILLSISLLQFLLHHYYSSPISLFIPNFLTLSLLPSPLDHFPSTSPPFKTSVTSLLVFQGVSGPLEPDIESFTYSSFQVNQRV